MTAMPIAKSPFQKAIAGNSGVGGLMSIAYYHQGDAATVRWVNSATAFAMFLAFLAVFAVKLRWD